MKALLRDIADQMHHCAALMSDPHTMRHRSETVANQITLTARKIEQLKVYLQRPADLPGDRHWFDKSILEGVDYLVYKTMERHLRPLYRDFKFPCVFHSDFIKNMSKRCKIKKDANHSVHGESLAIREIKETNCMGALILLFYSLYWNVALIAINRNKNPGWSHDGEDEEVDFEADLWSILPSCDDLFEHRRFARILVACQPAGDGKHADVHAVIKQHDVFQDVMIDDKIMGWEDAPKQRSSNAMKVLMKVLNASRKVLKASEEGEEEENPDTLNSMINACLGDCIRSRLDWFGRVMSTFEMQDSISKWDDMCRRFVVQSDSADAHERCKCKYEYCLLEVLTQDPYNPFGASPAGTFPPDTCQSLRNFAVYDYGSISLMMDISKTLIPLSKFAHGAAVLGVEDTAQILALCANVCVHGTENLVKSLSGFKPVCGVLKAPSSEFHQTKFIDQALGPFRPKIRIGDLLNRRDHCVMIDDLAGLYWGSASCDLLAFNHSYLACPSFEKDLSGLSELTKALQSLCLANRTVYRSEFIHAFLVRLHRNSMFVSHISQSLLRFLNVYAKTQTNSSEIFDVRGLCCMPFLVGDVHTAEIIFGVRDLVVTDSEITRLVSLDPKKPLRMSLPKVKKLLKDELDALQSRILLLSSKPFNKYPGISWPLEFGADHSENNLEWFNVIGKMPVVTRTSRESLSSMADLSDLMFEGISKAEEKAKLARAALRRIGSMGGASDVLDDAEESDTDLTDLQQAEGQVRAAEAAITEIQRALTEGGDKISADQAAVLRQQLETATQRATDLRAAADAARRGRAEAAARRQAERERRGAPRTNARV